MRSHLEELVRRARRRHVANRLLAALLFSTSVALAAFLLILVAGAAVLDWRLCLVVFVAALGWKLWPLRRVPSRYEIAQQVDRRLGLPDTLSTAVFFHDSGSRRASAGMRQAQRRQAEECSRGVELKRAAPIEAPQSFRAAFLLAVACVALLGVRWTRFGSLDLRPPMARAALGIFFSEERAAAASPARRPLPPAWVPDEGLRLDDASNPIEATPADGAVASTDVPDVSNEGAVPYRSADRPEPSAPAEESAESMANGAAEGDSRPSDSSAATGSQGSRTPNSPRPSQRPEDSGLLARLRDALADLLNRLKIQPEFGESRAAGERGRMPSEGQQPGSGQKATPGRSNEGAAEAGDSAFEPQAGDEMAQAGRGPSGDRPGEQPAPGKERSGIGKEEGNKDVREAEQLAAMGKISELIGRRAQNVSGEVTVEVLSSRHQQLKTPYMEKHTTHGDSGGQIHRDEIPLIYQEYVQRYFEEVHKNARAPR